MFCLDNTKVRFAVFVSINVRTDLPRCNCKKKIKCVACVFGQLALKGEW